MSIRTAISDRLKKFEKEFITLNRVEIYRSAVLHNYDLYRKISKSTDIIPVLKSNAYGHGINQIASILKSHTFPYIAVDGYFEALQIHNLTRQSVLVMGAIHPSNFANIDFSHTGFVVHQQAIISALGETNRAVKIHLELETGMNRHGVKLQELSAFLKLIKKYPKLQVEGVMTHFADAADRIFTAQQTDLFDTGIDTIKAAGFSPSLFHCAQSAGSITGKSKYSITPRIGIGLYGVNPLPLTDPDRSLLSRLQPALRAVSTITVTHELEAGDTVSYGRTFTATRPSRIGIIPFGYYEGLPRALSNCGQVGWHDSYLPVIGRICMNHTMLDLTDSPAQEGDEVTIISSMPTDLNSIESISGRHNLYSYTILVGISQNVRRVIV